MNDKIRVEYVVSIQWGNIAFRNRHTILTITGIIVKPLSLVLAKKL